MRQALFPELDLSCQQAEMEPFAEGVNRACFQTLAAAEMPVEFVAAIHDRVGLGETFGMIEHTKNPSTGVDAP